MTLPSQISALPCPLEFYMYAVNMADDFDWLLKVKPRLGEHHLVLPYYSFSYIAEFDLLTFCFSYLNLFS